MPQSAGFVLARQGTCVPDAVRSATWVTGGDALLQFGIRAVPVGIAAVLLALVLKWAGTQPGRADSAAPDAAVSVFGTIHADIFRFRVPLGSGRPADRVQVASLEPQAAFAALASRFELASGTSVVPCRESDGDCPASFDDRFTSAMPVRAVAIRMRAGRDADTPDAEAPRSITFRVRARKLDALPGDDGHTAVYDITAHMVYLPGGRTLEAHSGLGGLRDNPRHVRLKMRGPTPPNVYNLTMRERIFHGVRALRLNPVDNSRMHGRDGILAHSYMLGPEGQSNGCVVFRNYSEFLEAYRKGEVTRIVVVDRLDGPRGRLAAGELPQPVRELMKATDPTRQYADAGPAGGPPSAQDTP